MQYRNLGKWGVKVSALSFGSWLTFGRMMDNETAEKCMILAYDNGINFFDNAEGYESGKSEEVMGAILHRMNWRRDSFLVSSKVYYGVGDKPNQKGLSKKHVFEACHAALKRLRVEYLDFYYCHRADSYTPTEETCWAMHQLIMQGKVLYWGTSEWSAQQIMEAWGFCMQHHLVPPAVEQTQYNMFLRDRFEKEYQRLFKEIGLGTTTFSPLASGLLTGKYNEGIPEGTRMELGELGWLREYALREEKINKVKKLQILAKELSCTMPQLALAWVLKNPNVSSVILGATRPSQLEENFKSIAVVDKLNGEVVNKIEEILQNKPELPKT